ncbi:hypothetical protein KJ596_03355 [Patescibacteria group bacterium]|nr:hypothetical protein [Patescibacteria group bacterium]MBU1867925.1 hypothetical protein [Patescibacteria group bacterium]
MSPVYFATTNKKKFTTISNTLLEYGIKVIHHNLQLPEPRGDNLREITNEKIQFAYHNIQKPCLALDSGFFIHSLNGFPKTYVNFALETIGIEGLLKLVEGKSRDCEFRSCLAYLDNPSLEPTYFETTISGTLTEKPQGLMDNYCWSKLFLIFKPTTMNTTLAEMGLEEYQEWRSLGLEDSFTTKFAKWFSSSKK